MCVNTSAYLPPSHPVSWEKARGRPGQLRERLRWPWQWSSGGHPLEVLEACHLCILASHAFPGLLWMPLKESGISSPGSPVQLVSAVGLPDFRDQSPWVCALASVHTAIQGPLPSQTLFFEMHFFLFEMQI